ncbi:MAG TPA: ABC transporter permease [Thermomicrobiaceae bacterium]|nr:ABC transporter permease [Thermomicrobiaceae bacterium]
MHPKLILTIFKKDLRAAIKDGRVLVAIIVPIALGVFYSFIFPSSTPLPSATIAYQSAGPTSLPQRLQALAGDQVKLEVRPETSPQQVRQAVDKQSADVGLVIPANFDAAVAAGQSPPLTVIRRETSTFGANFVQAALNNVLREMAGQQDPAKVAVNVIPKSTGSQTVFEEINARRYFVLAAAVMVIGMIGMLAVPIILTDEQEKKTLDALVMIASYVDVVIAKALVGIVYIAVSLTLLLGITGTRLKAPVLFVGGAFLLSVAVLGFGLMLAGIFKSANQLNTWSGVILIPIIAPAFIVGFGGPKALRIIMDVLPTSQAMKILINGLDNKTYFTDIWLSFLVILAWGVIAYVLLLWSLRRRQA